VAGWRIAALALAALGLAGCSEIGEPEPVAEGTDIVDRGVSALTAAEVEIYLRNSTLSHAGETRDWHVYLAEDGTLRGVGLGREDRSRETARGVWRVTPDGLICRQWDGDWGGGLAGCARVYRYGDEYVFVADGAEGEAQEVRRTRRPGNVQKL